MLAMKINRIVGAILTALIIVKVSDLAGGALGQAKPLAKPAYLVERATAAPQDTKTAGTNKPVVAKPSLGTAIGQLLAAANAESGKMVARKCTICHNLKKGGKAKVGPALWGIVGAKKAAGSFKYSGALKGLGGVWDYTALNTFLTIPKAFAPGNKMSSFAGIKKDTDRASLILYLRSLSDSPIPLP